MIPKLTCLGALVSFLFLPSSFLPAQLAQPNGAGLSARVTVSVADFGAVSDGRTDSTEPLKRAFAFAASHSGTRLHFPCAAAGNTYLITSPLALPEHAALVGDHGTDCKILYNPTTDPGPIGAAFSISGRGYTTIDTLELAAGSAHPPACILSLGRISGMAGANRIENSAIQGYATKTLVFSQSSENNRWVNDTFRLKGGGAHHAFYTSATDDFGICPKCQFASNLSTYFDRFIFIVEVPELAFTAVTDHVGGGTGDHYFHEGYIGLNKNPKSIGFEIISGTHNQGGPNSAVSIQDTRIENGGFGFFFKKDDQAVISSFNIEGVTWSSGLPGESSGQAAPGSVASTYFAYGDNGLKLDLFTMAHNIARQHGVSGPSSFDSLTNSVVTESYGPITIRGTAEANVFTMLGNGRVILGGPAQRSANTWIGRNAEAIKK